MPLELRPWWPVIWKEKKVKTGDVEAAETLNESECSSERPKEIKRAGQKADAFLSAPSWAIVVEISLVACSIWRQESRLVQGGGLFLKPWPHGSGWISDRYRPNWVSEGPHWRSWTSGILP